MVLQSVSNKFARQRVPASRFTRTVLTFVVADILFLLFITYGYAFPSKMTVPEPHKVLPLTEYDYSAKVSPFAVNQKSDKVRPAQPRT